MTVDHYYLSYFPPPADQDLPICTDSPAFGEIGETQKALQSMKSSKASGLDCVITAEA